MRLRTAIKIQRNYREPHRTGWRPLKWKASTFQESKRICRRKWSDRRVPYIPSEEEELESFGIRMWVLGEILIDDPEVREEFHTRLWLDVDEAKEKLR
jgi:hypothetical protein